MKNIRAKPSLQKEQESKLRNKRSPDKNSFVSKSSKTVNLTLKRSSSNTSRSNNNSEAPYNRKITEYFFKSPQAQVSNSDRNSSNEFCKDTLSPNSQRSDNEVNYKENGIRTGCKFNDEMDVYRSRKFETHRKDEKSRKTEKYTDDKFMHLVNVSSEALANDMKNEVNKVGKKSETKVTKTTSCDINIPSYRQIMKDKNDCDTYIRKVQHLESLVTPLSDIEKSSGSCNYNTRSRNKSSSNENNEYRGYEMKLKSPKGTKKEIQAKTKTINSSVHKSRREQRKSPTTKITKFLECTLKTKQKLDLKVDSPNKSNRKLDFQKLEKENCNHSNTSNKTSLESKKSNSTFEKYGIYVPSYQDILTEKKNYDSYTDLVENLTKLVVPLPEIKTNDFDNQTHEIKVLNCKHMSKEDLFRSYENNIQYIEDIISGKIISERHEKYKMVTTRVELTYNTSMITFTNEQKQLLVTDLCEKYGQTSAHSDYYFKVLLPELCLKIFMDEHSMSQEEATEYLDCYPV